MLVDPTEVFNRTIYQSYLKLIIDKLTEWIEKANDYLQWIDGSNSIDVTTFDNHILRIDCCKAEDGLKITPCSQNSLNALAVDEPLEYARLALDGEMQAWVDAINSLEVSVAFKFMMVEETGNFFVRKTVKSSLKLS